MNFYERRGVAGRQRAARSAGQARDVFDGVPRQNIVTTPDFSLRDWHGVDFDLVGAGNHRSSDNSGIRQR
jgi:hypothetical protein